MAGRYGSGIDAQSIGRSVRRLVIAAGLIFVVLFFGCQATTRGRRWGTSGSV